MKAAEEVLARHLLPSLRYAHSALEPHVDARTMMLHHDKHHAGYVKSLNAALEAHPALMERTATWLLLNPEKIPAAVRTAVCNNAGGHVNHSMFWLAMSPQGGGEPSGPLADAIKHDFGSVAKFRSRFEEAGEKVFGSGWVWLVKRQHEGGRLEVMTTAGHENPLTQDCFPLLVNDVWEHAYYLQHESRRAAYLKGWWSVTDWSQAARRYEVSDATNGGRAASI